MSPPVGVEHPDLPSRVVAAGVVRRQPGDRARMRWRVHNNLEDDQVSVGGDST